MKMQMKYLIIIIIEIKTIFYRIYKIGILKSKIIPNSSLTYIRNFNFMKIDLCFMLRFK